MVRMRTVARVADGLQGATERRLDLAHAHRERAPVVGQAVAGFDPLAAAAEATLDNLRREA